MKCHIEVKVCQCNSAPCHTGVYIRSLRALTLPRCLGEQQVGFTLSNESLWAMCPSTQSCQQTPTRQRKKGILTAARVKIYLAGPFDLTRKVVTVAVMFCFVILSKTKENGS